MLKKVDSEKKFNVKVRAFPGAFLSDMFHFLAPLLNRSPKYVILHIGCNDAANKISKEIFNDLLYLKKHIQTKLPSSQIFVSCPVIRTDNAKANLTLHRLRNCIMDLGHDIIIHDNKDNSCLGKAGLHLNARGIGRLVMNFMSLMRRLYHC